MTRPNLRAHAPTYREADERHHWRDMDPLDVPHAPDDLLRLRPAGRDHGRPRLTAAGGGAVNPLALTVLALLLGLLVGYGIGRGR